MQGAPLTSEYQAIYEANLAEQASGGRFVPVVGGILIRDGADEVVGAVGISGDTSENDEKCGIAGIEAAGLKADPGVTPACDVTMRRCKKATKYPGG